MAVLDRSLESEATPYLFPILRHIMKLKPETFQSKVSILLILMVVTGDQMSRFSLSRTLAIAGVVLNLGVGSVVLGQGTTTAPVAPAPSGGGFLGMGVSDSQAERTRVQGDKNACNAAVKEMNKAAGDFYSACKEAGISKTNAGCGDALDSCSAEQAQENPLGLGSNLFDITSEGNSAKCTPLNYKEYKSDLKEFKTGLKDAETHVAELNEKVLKTKKDIAEKKKDQNKDLLQLKKDKEEAEQKMKDDEKILETKTDESINAMEEKLAKLQSDTIDAMNTKSQLITERGNQVDDYKAELLSCKSSTLEYQAKLKLNTSGGLSNSSLSGSMGTANSRSASQKKDVQDFWQICANKVLRARDNKSKAYDLKMASLDNQIAILKDQKSRLEKTKALMMTQKAQTIAEAAKKKDLSDRNIQIAADLKNQEFDHATALFKEETATLNSSLKKADLAVKTASNDLDKYQKTPPTPGTTKSNSDVAAAQAKYSTADCSDVCRITPEREPSIEKDPKGKELKEYPISSTCQQALSRRTKNAPADESAESSK